MGNTLEDEVGALLDERVDACRAKDIDRLMALYSPDVVYFDVVPPLHFTGTDPVRRNFQRWFDEYEGPIGLTTVHQQVAVSGDVAFAHMMHHDTGPLDADSATHEQVEDRSLWLRSTVCLRRAEHGWRITHEHISLPVDLRSMQAVLDLTP
jgi:uncharacterized protein (TIGR02246 family)